MALFLLKRLGVMLLTAFVLTFIVFILTNLDPNLEKLAKTEAGSRMTDEETENWLTDRGYRQPLLTKYGQWLGVLPGYTYVDNEGKTRGRCILPGMEAADAPTYCGILEGKWGWSTSLKAPVGEALTEKLKLTGKLMFWVLIIMIPSALLIGVLAGMREGSRMDRTLSTISIFFTATPEYVSGVILSIIFASSAVGLMWVKGSSVGAMKDANFENFALPVITVSLYGMGYIARMTRASMAEVMTQQYIRTARLKGVSFNQIVLKHALRNALIAPFTVIMLQIPWLLTGVVVVEKLFNYKGFGWAMITAAGNNDIELLLGISVISVVIVLLTQLISDIGYVYLNPRIRIA